MSAGTSARARVLVSGRVQGVGYRAFAQRAGARAGLHGGVRNLPDGRVEVEAEGAVQTIERFLEQLRMGPPLAMVREIEVAWEEPRGLVAGFEIWY